MPALSSALPVRPGRLRRRVRRRRAALGRFRLPGQGHRPGRARAAGEVTGRGCGGSRPAGHRHRDQRFLQHHGEQSAATREVSRLSARERDALVLLSQGLPNADFGCRLHLSIGTVKDYVSALLAKLDVSNRVQAALWAQRAGLLDGADRWRTVRRRTEPGACTVPAAPCNLARWTRAWRLPHWPMHGPSPEPGRGQRMLPEPLRPRPCWRDAGGRSRCSGSRSSPCSSATRPRSARFSLAERQRTRRMLAGCATCTALRASGSRDAGLAPQPAPALLDSLIADSGLDVTLTGEVPRDASPAVERAASRTVQEALTNVRKHAPGSTVVVEFRRPGPALDVTATNSTPGIRLWDCPARGTDCSACANEPNTWAAPSRTGSPRTAATACTCNSRGAERARSRWPTGPGTVRRERPKRGWTPRRRGPNSASARCPCASWTRGSRPCRLRSRQQACGSVTTPPGGRVRRARA
ncbi:LuxR C-terminal-related transcriptional regulator [Streptomyces sp. MB09-01]|nr:LuxR C-terminal-related transcriptional regulator [Streptomyces sp. MB09-01]MDX3538332.1 LuxR C-terminal-related transcriptional regulator [Streptomyces sp. MB09-01]